MPSPPQPPRGKGFLADAPADRKPPVAAYRVNVDGGSRGNPGRAAYGVVVRDPRGEVVAKLKKYIGRSTNNVAEYYGLIAALEYAQAHGARALRVESDSELLVKQMRGLYKVKSGDLRPLFERAKKMSESFESFRIEHVYREQNREADALANEALDETEDVPAGPSVVKTDSANSGSLPSKKDSVASRPDVRKIRARYRGGILYPLEDIDLPDGTELEIYLRFLSKR